MDIEKMFGTIYIKALNHVSLDDFKGYLDEYEERGLLFTWDQHHKMFGYFTGASSGRLVAPSQRYNRQTPEPPIDDLRDYCSQFNILNDAVLSDYPLPSDSLAQAKALHRTNNNNKYKYNIKDRAKKSPEPVDNSTTQDDAILQQIDDLREKLGKTYWINEVHKFVLMQIKLKTKPKAILFCLMAIDKKRPSNPWGYAETVLQDYNDSKYNKTDNVFKDIVEKLKEL
jgi:hypothetical protein